MSGMTNHNQRYNHTPNADEDLTKFNRTPISISGTKSIVKDVNLALEQQNVKPGKGSVLAVEHMMTFSPEWVQLKKTSKGGLTADDPQQAQDRLNAFEKHCIDWLKERYGSQNLVNYSCHYDETTFHIHAYVTPIRTKEVKYKNRHGSGTKTKNVLDAKHWFNGKEKMIALQDDFFHSVGKKCGLQRGEKNSKAEHVEIQKWYGRIQKAIELDKHPDHLLKKFWDVLTAEEIKKISPKITSGFGRKDFIKIEDYKEFKEDLIEILEKSKRDRDERGNKILNEVKQHYWDILMADYHHSTNHRKTKKELKNLKKDKIDSDLRLSKSQQAKEVAELSAQEFAKALQKVGNGQMTRDELNKILEKADRFNIQKPDDLDQNQSKGMKMG